MSHWRRSGVEESQLEDFAVKGFLPPREKAGWRAPPPEHEEPQLEPHEVGTSTPEKAFVKALEGVLRNRVVKEGLEGLRLFHTVRKRRVTPLAERKRLMWLYSGPSDPDRMFAEELPEHEVWSLLLMVLKGADQEGVGGPAPFSDKNPPNLGLGHSRSRPRLPKGPEGMAKQIAFVEAAKAKKKTKRDKAAKRQQ
ncbi:hypothetical protein C2845_PM07G12860 [Panicum miliaceum]|uniref:Uncharacterized protein n=1 Tax=Panicum miliaceum TaxID=4540 RepID=A0A3L6SPN3_PANMI|nr:hypothetical protein C2845_PM07G12860 [Panicum miliaceum]